MRMDTKTELIGGGTIAVIALGVVAYFIFKDKFNKAADNALNAESGVTGLVKTTTDQTGETIKAITDLNNQQFNFLTSLSGKLENYLLTGLDNKINNSNIDQQNKVYDQIVAKRVTPDNMPTDAQAQSDAKAAQIMKDNGFKALNLPQSISQNNAASNVAAQKQILATVAKDEKSAIVGQWYTAPSGLSYQKK
jgi:hypothetical protein